MAGPTQPILDINIPEAEQGYIAPDLAFAKMLTVDGTDTGSVSMKVNGSVTPVYLYREVAAEQTWLIKGIGLTIGGAANAALVPTNFGDIAGLTNGIQLQWYNGSAWADLIYWNTGSGIGGAVNNVNLQRYASTMRNLDGGTGIRYWELCYHFDQMFGKDLILTAGRRIGWKISDNLSTLNATPTAHVIYRRIA